jgi:hypothetical protein
MIPENLVPLIYVLAAAAVAAGLQFAGVPEGTIGLIVGAAITRVKISSAPDEKKL